MKFAAILATISAAILSIAPADATARRPAHGGGGQVAKSLPWQAIYCDDGDGTFFEHGGFSQFVFNRTLSSSVKYYWNGGMEDRSEGSEAGTGMRVTGTGQPANSLSFIFGEFGTGQFGDSIGYPFFSFFVQTPNGLVYSEAILLNQVPLPEGITEQTFANGYTRITVDVPEYMEFAFQGPNIELPPGSTLAKFYYMDYSAFFNEDGAFSNIVYDVKFNSTNAVPVFKNNNPNKPSTLVLDCTVPAVF